MSYLLKLNGIKWVDTLKIKQPEHKKKNYTINYKYYKIINYKLFGL